MMILTSFSIEAIFFRDFGNANTALERLSPKKQTLSPKFRGYIWGDFVSKRDKETPKTSTTHVRRDVQT